MKVKFKDWHEGMLKVSFTRLQVESLGLGLKEAKENTDTLLAGKEVEVDVPSHETAKIFLQKAQKLGVTAIIIENFITPND